MSLLDYEDITQRLRTIAPGQRVIYFIGFLDSERLERPKGAAVAAATLALELCFMRRVQLVQRRLGKPLFRSNIDWRNGHGPGFEYIAIGMQRGTDAD